MTPDPLNYLLITITPTDFHNWELHGHRGQGDADPLGRYPTLAEAAEAALDYSRPIMVGSHAAERFTDIAKSWLK